MDMRSLVVDIETVGENFETLDSVTQGVLTRWIERESQSEEEYAGNLEDLKNGLGFSPLTGEIVVIGMHDVERSKNVVYFQAPGESMSEFEENGVLYKQKTEREMLEDFWNGAGQYGNIITFNGRGFDVPFIMVRSAVHGIRPTKDFMSNRYLKMQKFNAIHIDLLDQLTFYGSVRKRGGLHLWCRAFGIESPKANGVDGDDVSRLFQEKKYIDIARYNVRDLEATRKLYDYWERYLRFS